MIITVSVSNLGGLGISSGKTSLISSTHSICFWGSSVGLLSVSSSQSHSLLPLYCRGFLSAHSVTARQYFYHRHPAACYTHSILTSRSTTVYAEVTTVGAAFALCGTNEVLRVSFGSSRFYRPTLEDLICF